MSTPSTQTQPSPELPRQDFDAELQALAREATAAEEGSRAGEGSGSPPAQSPAPVAAPILPAPTVDLSPVLDELRRLASVETANRQLFDALHGELRQYRDGFLLESLHLPVIRDLLSLLDDMESVRCQVGALLPGSEGAGTRARGEVARSLERTAQNIENTLHFLREILQRMDVQEVREGAGAFDRTIHRQVGVTPATEAGPDGRIASVVRGGFVWRTRTLRPAEVIVHRPVSPQP